jgi:hypothetical protein
VIRVLAEKWGLEVKKMKVVVGQLPLKNVGTSASRTQRPVFVNVDENDVKELEQDYLKRSPDLPENAALSLAHLKIFFTKRFGKGQ